MGEILGGPVLEGWCKQDDRCVGRMGSISFPLHPSRARPVPGTYNTVWQVAAREKYYKNITYLLQECYRGKGEVLKSSCWILDENLGLREGVKTFPSLPRAGHFQGNECGVTSGKNGRDRRPASQGPDEAVACSLFDKHLGHLAF